VFLVLVPRVAASLPASSSLLSAATTGRRFMSSRHALVASITVIRVSLGLSALGQVCAIISNSNKPDLTLLET
jgi:hypothetical protein